ncbi:8985_t:CDS:1, partial [Rhizophagus irregularis]
VINPENIQGVTEHDVKEMINNTSANNESYYYGNEHEKDDEIT